MTNEEEEDRIVREHDERIEREKQGRSKFAIRLMVTITIGVIALVVIFILILRTARMKSLLG